MGMAPRCLPQRAAHKAGASHAAEARGTAEWKATPCAARGKQQHGSRDAKKSALVPFPWPEQRVQLGGG